MQVLRRQAGWAYASLQTQHTHYIGIGLHHFTVLKNWLSAQGALVLYCLPPKALLLYTPAPPPCCRLLLLHVLRGDWVARRWV